MSNIETVPFTMNVICMLITNDKLHMIKVKLSSILFRSVSFCSVIFNN